MTDDLRIALRIRARDETQPAVRSARRGIAAAGVEIERLEARFRAATGSASAARAELEFTLSEARRLGIDFRAAADAYSGFAAAARRAGGVQGACRRRGVTVASYSPRPARRTLILTSRGEAPSSSSLDRPGQKAPQRRMAGTKASTQAMNAAKPLSTATAAYKRTSRAGPQVTSMTARTRKRKRAMPGKG